MVVGSQNMHILYDLNLSSTVANVSRHCRDSLCSATLIYHNYYQFSRCYEGVCWIETYMRETKYPDQLAFSPSMN